ncbi:hypothetical protein AB0I53_31395 [Saccharopolyspora sp. NPDC050389]|uniref:hypothetical protein n=1 Tax=Saccharopolyspora sp. NPDC050389 TaxID=3155516 RepID=UPI0033E0DA34
MEGGLLGVVLDGDQVQAEVFGGADLALPPQPRNASDETELAAEGLTGNGHRATAVLRIARHPVQGSFTFCRGVGVAPQFALHGGSLRPLFTRSRFPDV